MNTLLNTLKPWILVTGRVLIAAIFVTAGWSKIGGYEGTQQYMQAMGVLRAARQLGLDVGRQEHHAGTVTVSWAGLPPARDRPAPH